MNNIKLMTTPSRFAMPISGHQCAFGMDVREAGIVRDRAVTLGVAGLAVAYDIAVKGAFPGPDAWSPPI